MINISKNSFSLNSSSCTIRTFSTSEDTQKPIDIPSDSTSTNASTPEPKFDFNKVSYASTSAHEFRAETKQLLDIFSKSLYKDTDAFVRELISNSNDAMEKQRILDLQQNSSTAQEELNMQIFTDPSERTFALQDLGIGFTFEQLKENVGTIASSGTKKFSSLLKQSEQSGESVDSLIGQFGVGFYSAFVVADKVEIFTKSADSPVAYYWSSTGDGDYNISEVKDNLPFSRGTYIKCHLKQEFEKYSREQEIIDKIKKFSQFTKYPIYVNESQVNTQAPIWTRSAKEVTTTEYQDFYEYVTKTKQAYKYKMHFKTDLPLDLTALLYIPSSNQEMMGSVPLTTEVNLYSRRVLIKAHCEELLPKWLRFVKGVVDCADLSLNVSREMAQDSHMMAKLNDLLTKRILRQLKSELEADEQRYNSWYKDFNQFLKEGLVISTQQGQASLKDAIVPLLRVEVSYSNDMTGLEQYLTHMKPNQKSIYVLYAKNRQAAEKSPYIEIFKKNNIPVVYLYTHNDDIVFKSIENYKGLKIKGIESGLEEIEDLVEKFEHDHSKGLPQTDVDSFLSFVKESLGSGVSKVITSKRLYSEACAVSGHMPESMKEMMRMVERENPAQFEQFKAMMQQQNPITLELNPNHELVVKLNAVRKLDADMGKDIATQMFENAQVMAGVIDDPKSMLKRIEKFMDMALDQTINKSLTTKL